MINLFLPALVQLESLDLRDRHDMIELESDVLSSSQKGSSLNHVLDLSAVEFQLAQETQFPGRDGGPALSINEVGPDTLSSLSIKLGIVDSEMNARLESRVKGGYAISCQEQYALVVLEHS